MKNTPQIERKLIIDLEDAINNAKSKLQSPSEIRSRAIREIRKRKELDLIEEHVLCNGFDEVSKVNREEIEVTPEEIEIESLSIKENQDRFRDQIRSLKAIATDCTKEPILIDDPTELLTPEQDWDPNDFDPYILFHHILYSFSGPFTLDEFMLECLQEFDKERTYFEELRMKFSEPDDTEAEIEESKRRSIPVKVRRFVWRRDGGKCAKCGSRERLEYDHIIPVSKGGGNTARNVELLCEECNRAKSDSIG